MNIADLEGRTYGPRSWTVNADAVAAYESLTGADGKGFAPPGFAAAALFAVAPELLAELYEMSVIHGEQSFAWNGPIEIGHTYTVTGEVSRVRERGGVHFVTFEVEAGDVLTAKALFLVSGDQPAAGSADAGGVEPAVGDKGGPEEGQRSASRADLVRYAAATRDWNPVHWDHEAATDAGFPGVVVHGLLQAGWALAAFDGDPASTRIRFRNPLKPAHPVDVKVNGNNVTLSDVDTEYLTATITVA